MQLPIFACCLPSQIRDETGSRIRVVEGIPQCDERVIVISAPDEAPEVEHNAAQVVIRHPRSLRGFCASRILLWFYLADASLMRCCICFMHAGSRSAQVAQRAAV